MVLGMALPSVPIGASAVQLEAPVAENDVAWGEMPAYSDLKTNQTYFTDNEWKGTTVGGVDNAAVVGINIF